MKNTREPRIHSLLLLFSEPDAHVHLRRSSRIWALPERCGTIGASMHVFKRRRWFRRTSEILLDSIIIEGVCISCVLRGMQQDCVLQLHRDIIIEVVQWS